MRFRCYALGCAAFLLLAACSDDSTVAPPPGGNPSTDRYVNQATGDDGNNGSSGAPWATITHALATADTFVTIRVAPGTYDAANGESFPLIMKKGQTLVGNVAGKGAGGTPTLIQGEGAYSLDQLDWTALLGADRARVAGFSIVSATDPNFYAGITVDGGSMEIDNNTFPTGSYAGIGSGNDANLDAHDNLMQTGSYSLVVDNSSVVRIHGNTMETGAYAVRCFGIDSLTVENNTIGTSTTGVQAGGGSWVMIRGNTFDRATDFFYGGVAHSGGATFVRGNTFLVGPGVYIDTGLSVPDLGTVASPGQNDFSGLTGAAVEHAGQGTVMAIGNTWANNPPQVGVDILITGGGSVVTQ